MLLQSSCHLRVDLKGAQTNRSWRRLFRWLPMYNLTVIALTLAYQAPLHELTFGKWTAADKVRMIPSVVKVTVSNMGTPGYAATMLRCA